MTIIHVVGEDWHGLYINNTLVYQNHSISLGQFFDVLNDVGGFPCVISQMEEWGLDAEQQNHLDEVGLLPENLEGLVTKW